MSFKEVPEQLQRSGKLLPPAVESEIPEDERAAAEYFESHDVAPLFETGEVDIVYPPQPVGVLEIAQRAKVRPITVQKWRERHHSFPRPRWTVSGLPAWDWWEVAQWLRHPRPVGRPRTS